LIINLWTGGIIWARNGKLISHVDHNRAELRVSPDAASSLAAPRARSRKMAAAEYAMAALPKAKLFGAAQKRYNEIA